MNRATPTMDAVELAFRSGIVPGPPGDPAELFLQLGILSGRRIVKLLWSRSCPVDVNFKRNGNARRLAVSGVGLWFAPVCVTEAFIFCAAPLARVRGAADFPAYPRTPTTPLNELAEWVRSVALPGAAEGWRAPVRFKRSVVMSDR